MDVAVSQLSIIQTKQFYSISGHNNREKRMEGQTDMYISTLRKYIKAMGGDLEIIAKFPEGSVRIEKFETL